MVLLPSRRTDIDMEMTGSEEGISRCISMVRLVEHEQGCQLNAHSYSSPGLSRRTATSSPPTCNSASQWTGKTIYPKACFAVGENRCGLIQIRQNEEPPFYLFLCPAFKKPSRKPEGHILVSLAEDAEDEDSEGGWNLSDGFEYSQLLCKLNDLE
jgi:hypothetical protein